MPAIPGRQRLSHHGVADVEKIFAIESLTDLQTYLESKPRQQLRNQLAKSFLRLCLYENAMQWNKAVRLCEGLAIVGWGEYEPVQAERGVFWNGNPETTFFNRYSECRFVNAIWSKRKSGVTMEQGRTSYHESPDLPGKKSQGDEYPVRECTQEIQLATQRNWIPKNPILITRGISNCYQNSEKLAAEVEQTLMPALDKQMTPEAYGTAINRIVINYHLSYADAGSRANYVILDEDVRLSSQQLHQRLKTMYSTKEIERNGYFLRKRYDFGNFSQVKGSMKVDIHFPKQFSEQSIKDQKQEYARHLTEAVEGTISRLKAKKLGYDFERMCRDFQIVLRAWLQ